MYVRLAFAVAAHLEPEILIVDEVLAVGDAEFQKKCLGKMKDVSVNQGRTVLFVTHQLGSIQQLCERVFWINKGSIKLVGNPSQVIQQYINSNSIKTEEQFEASEEELAKGIHIKKFSLSNSLGKQSLVFGTNESIFIKIDFGASNEKQSLEIAVAVFDFNETRVFTIHEPLFNDDIYSKIDSGTITIELPAQFLAPGSFYFVATIHIPHIESFHLIEGVCKFSVIDTGSNLSDYDGVNIGVVYPQYKLIRKYD
jgi:lipopolysaccharide transport system ATP-binding protein